jgi:hypothetical protein
MSFINLKIHYRARKGKFLIRPNGIYLNIFIYFISLFIGNVATLSIARMYDVE